MIEAVDLCKHYGSFAAVDHLNFTVRRGEVVAFLGPNGHFLGDLQTDNWVAWDLRIMDSHARQVATITRDWAGLDMTNFSRPDVDALVIGDYLVTQQSDEAEAVATRGRGAGRTAGS